MSFSGMIALATVIQSCCEITSATEAESLARGSNDACSANHAKGAMSVVVPDRVAGVDNEALQNRWNSAMKTFIRPNVMSIKSVETATGEADSVRYLQLDGSFGKGLGVGSKVFNTLFKEGGKGSGFGSGTITNVQEALEVKSPGPDTTSIFRRTFGLDGIENMLSSGHPDGEFPLFVDYTASEQWAPEQMHYNTGIPDLQAAANAVNPTKIVRVAVLDTGVDVDHPDLKDAIDRDLAYNALTGKAGPEHVGDAQGHGTHVAGIIAGQGIGQQRGMAASVLGIAGKFRVKIVPIKVLGDDGTGSTSAMSRGIRWAVAKKVDVISMSLGSGSNYDCLGAQSLKDPVIEDAISKGVIVVAAAGNESCPLGGACNKEGVGNFSNYIVMPCANDNVLCVGSNDNNEAPSTFSNYASGDVGSAAYRTSPDIIAPGTRILSTYPNTAKFRDYQGVALLNGTSMATPFISGIAAILKLTETADYKVNQTTLKTYLQESAYTDATYQQKFRAGRVDLQALMVNRRDKYINKTTQTATRGVRQTVPFSY